MIGIARRNPGLCLLVVILGAVLTSRSHAAEKVAPIECTILLDQQTGETLLRKGTCDQRISPMSTFKVALALIGYDADILTDEHTPRWNYKPEFNAEKRAQKPVDPIIWQKDSIVWFSQQITRHLGRKKFAGYVTQFDYGNMDVAGLKGGKGLTHAWIMSSLKISADEQVSFIQRLLGRQLPVSDRANEMTRRIIPVFAAGDGWMVHGKTGSGPLRDATGKIGGRRMALAWFVGWAEKGGRRIIFARMRIGTNNTSTSPMLALRTEFLNNLPELMGEK